MEVAMSALRWYEFDQNNSGGVFELSATVGHRVLVQACSAEVANRIAEDCGLYFGGYGDCQCCGSRWSPCWDDDEGEPELPRGFDHKTFQLAPYQLQDTLPEAGVRYAVVYFADGTRKYGVCP
jgi:hypothetical protein